MEHPINVIFSLLIWFQIKHFVADYILQGKYMLGKFKPGWDFVLPLLAHSAVHGVATLVLCLYLRPEMWWLALVDMSVHFVMDRIKASPKYLGRFKALSADEMKKIIAFGEVYPQSKIDSMNKDNSPWREAAQNIADSNSRLVRNNVIFWWALGLDQMVHHLSDLFIAYLLLTY